MKKILATLVLSLASLSSFAEASFDQIQVLIQQQNYSAAEKGLEEIIRNHPKSAKAFYAMSQAQAGLGNQDKAKKALDIATGLNPTLDFAPQSSVASLKEAITPQVKKIESIEESHVGRNLLIALLFIVVGGTVYVLYNRKKDEEEAKREADLERIREMARQAQNADRIKRESDEEAERQALRQHKNYGHERFDPQNPDVLIPLPKKKTKAQLKAEADADAEMKLREAQYQAKRAEQRANEEESLARGREAFARNNPTPAPTVIHTNNSGSDMLTGVLIGNMLSGSHHHDHETTRVVERERVIEREAPSRSSSWDDTPSTPLRSSSWDDDSSSKSSSSWSSSSSSDSSSSWSDSSSSSSSSSDSSSSWN